MVVCQNTVVLHKFHIQLEASEISVSLSLTQCSKSPSSRDGHDGSDDYSANRDTILGSTYCGCASQEASQDDVVVNTSLLWVVICPASSVADNFTCTEGKRIVMLSYLPVICPEVAGQVTSEFQH